MMYSLLIVAALLVVSQASIIGLGVPGATLIGPATKGTVVGPDGGVISAAAQAGAVQTNGALVAGVASPGIIAAASPGLIASPVLGLGTKTILAGPSGTVAATGLGLGGLGIGLGGVGLGLGHGALGLGGLGLI